jgi:4-amino-4-deoxy-L-arabinose transferase-like glycosyltransferase
MKKNISYILLGLILLVAIVTRFYKLGEAPAGLYVDEAGQGYSAYSILKTGRDEFGKPFPIVFRSLTDFKTPIYTYLIIPFIPLFGLNTFTVRFPSFFFSILTIPILYFLVKELSGNKNLALTSSLLLAISPWHILFGRTDFECTVALFLLLTGILLFYNGLKKPIFMIFSALAFALAFPAYQSERMIVPLTIIILFIRFRKILLGKSHKIYLAISIILGLIISLPTLSIILTPGFLARASGLNIFTHIRQMPAGFNIDYQGILSPIINGSWFLTTREFFALYFSYFSPRYMFSLGDYGPRSSYPELATFFIWQAPFYLWGLYAFLKQKGLSGLKFFVITLLILSPIPAAVTRDPYTTIRALPLVIPQIVIISYGIYDLAARIKNKKWHLIIYSCFLLIIVYSIFKLYSSVILFNEYYRAKYWDFGWRQVTDVLKSQDKSLPVVVDNARSDPDLELAFFLQYDPVKYQTENFEVSIKQYYTDLHRNKIKHVGTITTRPISWEEDLVVDQYLVGDELAISLEQIEIHKLNLIGEVRYPDGSVAFRIARTNSTYEAFLKRSSKEQNK